MSKKKPNKQAFWQRNRSKIDKLLQANQPPKKEKPVRLPRLKKVNQNQEEDSKQANPPKTVVKLPRLTRILAQATAEAPEDVVETNPKSLPKLKSAVDARRIGENSPKLYPLPKLQKIEKEPTSKKTKRKRVKVDLPKLTKIEKEPQQEEEDTSVLPPNFDRIDLPKLQRIQADEPQEETKTRPVLPDWVNQTLEPVKIKTTKPKKKPKKKPQEPIKEKAKKEVKNTLDFDRIGKASESEKDDLTAIKGIGKQTAQKLNKAGIYTYKQISKLNQADRDQLTKMINFFAGRMDRDNWVGQAKELMPDEPDNEIDFDRIGEVEQGDGDDLTRIKGIGPATAEKLNSLGIRSIEQIASMKTEDEALIEELIGFSEGRITKANWVGQAKELLE